MFRCEYVCIYCKRLGTQLWFEPTEEMGFYSWQKAMEQQSRIILLGALTVAHSRTTHSPVKALRNATLWTIRTKGHAPRGREKKPRN